MNFIYHPAVVDWDEVKRLVAAGHTIAISATLPAIGELCRATRENDCPACEADGVHATDGTGPYDCYVCGKKATREGDGDWLWCKLMDFCRQRRMPPAEYNDLFAIVGELRTLSRVAVQDDATGINPNETTAALRGMEKAP